LILVREYQKGSGILASVQKPSGSVIKIIIKIKSVRREGVDGFTGLPL